MTEPKTTSTGDRRQRVQSIETGMLVLKTLSRLGGAGSLTAVATACGEHPAKVHRYLASFVQEGFVAQNPATQHYHLGPEAVVIGMAALRQCDPVRLAESALVALREDLEITCFIAVMGNMGPTVMRIEEPVAPVTINVRAGSVLSTLWSASGRAFLGFSDDSSVMRRAEREWRDATPERQALLSGSAPIEALKRKVRKQGCAVVRDVLLNGVSAVAAPIFDAAGKCVAVLTALGATNGFDTSETSPVCGRVVSDAEAISTAMGHASG